MKNSDLQTHRIDFIANAKDHRDFDKPVSFAMVSDTWTFIITQQAMQDFFERTEVDLTFQATTFYGLLDITREATSQEIRKAYRDLSMKYHPDHDPSSEAADQFIKLTTAYKTLSDPTLRARYDAGLEFERAARAKNITKTVTYKPRWRNGLITGRIEFFPSIKLPVITKIVKWEGLWNDDRSQYLRSWWVSGDKSYTTEWITPQRRSQ
jgi:DnaJ-domain-containing protein 1